MLTFSLANAGQVDDIINGAISEKVGELGLDNLVSIDCSVFNSSPGDFKFSIFGCEVDASLDNCYESTKDSLKESLDFNVRHFDRNKLCKSYLNTEKEFFGHNSLNPYNKDFYFKPKELPDSKIEVEDRIAKEAQKISSSQYLAPKNIMAKKNQILKEIKKECSKSGDVEKCVIKKAIELSKKSTENYEKNEGSAFLSNQRTSYIASSQKKYLYEPTGEQLKKLPIQKKILFLKNGKKVMDLESLKRTHSNTNENFMALVYKKYEDVLARSMYLEDQGQNNNIADNSVSLWSLP